MYAVRHFLSSRRCLKDKHARSIGELRGREVCSWFGATVVILALRIALSHLFPRRIRGCKGEGGWAKNNKTKQSFTSFFVCFSDFRESVASVLLRRFSRNASSLGKLVINSSRLCKRPEIRSRFRTARSVFQGY